MSILVTGATGFIGAHLVRWLAERGESVHVLCRPTANVSLLIGKNIQIFRGDILDASTVERALAGCNRVFHLAAYARNWAKDPQTFYTFNVRGLRNVLTAALDAAVEKVVFTSSCVSLGPSNGFPTNEDSTRPPGFFTEYEHSKFEAEQEAQRFVQAGLNIVVVNPTRVFGPGLLNEGNSLTRMIQLYLNGKWRLILGNGCGVGNYTFVDDVVRGHLLAMEKGRNGERYILGGENVSYNDFFQVLSDVSRRHYRLMHIPASLALLASLIEKWRATGFTHYPLITPGWVRTFIADWAFSTEKAQRELGYIITPLHEALEITISWLGKMQTTASR